MDRRRFNSREEMRRQAAVRAHRDKLAKQGAKRKRAVHWQNHKLPLIAVFFICVLGVFLLEIARVQDFAGDVYAARALNQIIHFHNAGDRVIQPNRGTITDRNMQTLAVSSTVYNVFVDVRMLADRPAARAGQISELESNRLALTEFFGMTDAQFNAMMARDPATGLLINNTMYFVIERDTTHSRRLEFLAWLETTRDAVEGFRIRDIHFEESSRRTYVHNTLAAPVIGFERGAWWGLEGRFNQYLTGSPGRQMTTFDGGGNVITDRINPVHGANIITTLDLNIQRFSEEVATRWAQDFYARHASVIVLNPNTGEVIAMAQYPSFDPNAPADLSRLTSPDLAAYLEGLEEGSGEFFDQLFRIWANYNVSATFEPGSIYKPFTVVKALEEGLISPNHTFYCNGFVYRAGHRIHCWQTWGHGRVNVTEALAVSCNIAMIEIAEILGRNHFWQYQRDFGFGAPTGIDLPAEAAGILHPVSELNESELATASFGQRFNVTPIQMISAFASLINGGNVVRPHIVSQIIDTDGSILLTNRPVIERRVISRDTSDFMRRAMEYAITIGTAGGAAIEGYAQGGKTGTGEQGLQDSEDFTWSLSYIGYFPIESPQYLILVLLYGVSDEVYHARIGQRSVTPMYREIAQEIIRLRSIPPTIVPETFGVIHEPEFIENFVGLTVQEAVSRLNFLGINYEFIGVGGNVISSQFPAAGSRAAGGGTTVVLNLFDNGSETLFEVPDVVGFDLEFARNLLLHAGFFPRIVFDNHVGYDRGGLDVEAVITAQSVNNLRLPLGTEILLRARLYD